MIEHLDGLAESAEVIGAVNCAVRRGDRLDRREHGRAGVPGVAARRDGPRREADRALRGRRGGAGDRRRVRARRRGRRDVVNRSAERGAELAALVDGKTPPAATSCRGNTRSPCPPTRTSWSTRRRSASIRTSTRRSTSPSTACARNSSSPTSSRTRRGRASSGRRARGATVLDGLGMLVNQGVISVRHWTGVDPEPAVMRATVERIFGVGLTTKSRPAGGSSDERPAATYSPRPLRAKYHRRCGA